MGVIGIDIETVTMIGIIDGSEGTVNLDSDDIDQKHRTHKDHPQSSQKKENRFVELMHNSVTSSYGRFPTPMIFSRSSILDGFPRVLKLMSANLDFSDVLVEVAQIDSLLKPIKGEHVSSCTGTNSL